MKSDAKTGLCCIYLAIIVLIGSVIYNVEERGWWIDSTVSVVLSIFFAKEGIKMILEASADSFTGKFRDVIDDPLMRKS